MDPFNAARRELLRFGGIGLAAAVTTAVPTAYAAQRSSNPSASQGIFDIRSYGAVGDGKAVDSPAINKAIEAAAAAGGGTVLFPPGTWLSFSIRLKSHVALLLSQGATILAADSPLPGATTG
jgi:polygalacturonase